MLLTGHPPVPPPVPPLVPAALSVNPDISRVRHVLAVEQPFSRCRRLWHL
jgi:hypothetical protein